MRYILFIYQNCSQLLPVFFYALLVYVRKVREQMVDIMFRIQARKIVQALDEGDSMIENARG